MDSDTLPRKVLIMSRGTIRQTAVAVSLLLLLTATANAQTKGGWLRGAWEGTGYQIDDGSTWKMRLTARRNKYLIEYPSLNCDGEWRLVSINRWRARFKERIRSGAERCEPRGNVVIERLSGQQLAFRYSYVGTREVVASAILNRSK
jgi:hypothetical protein